MPLLNLIVILVVIGVAMWAVNTYIPMQEGIRRVLNIAVVALVVMWLLSVFGLLSDVNTIHVGR